MISRTKYLFVQFFTALFGVLLFLLQIFFNPSLFLTILLICIYAICSILHIFEWVFYRLEWKPYIRSILHVIGWIFFTFFMIISLQKDSVVPFDESMGLSLGGLLIAQTLFMLVTLLLKGTQKAYVIYDKKTLQIGNYSKKEEIFTFIGTLIYILSIAGIFIHIMNEYFIQQAVLVSLLWGFLGFVILISMKVCISNKPFSHFAKTLDLKKFEEDMEKREKENLHPETRNYIHIYTYFTAEFFHKDSVEFYYNRMKVPHDSNYRVFYDCVRLERLLWENVEIFDQEFAQLPTDSFYQKNKKLLKRFASLKKIRTLFEKSVEESQIEKILPIQNKNLLADIENCYTRICVAKYINNDVLLEKYESQYQNLISKANV